jgi:CDP-glycerol glycerophosphotransferase (TagB/SpsB family)
MGITARRLVLAAVFWLVDRLPGADRTAAMVVSRGAGLDADTQHLLTRLPDRIETVYVAVDSADDLEALPEDIRESIGLSELQVYEIDSLGFLRALRNAGLVTLKRPTQLHGYRLFARRDVRTVVLIYHGIITKAYGTHADSGPSLSLYVRLKRTARRLYGYAGLDVQSVASDVERFFRSSGEQRHPARFRRYGYPRYDRIDELQAGDAEPFLEDDLESRLQTDGPNLLYAPTHKDGVYTTTLFPFEAFDSDELASFLETHDARLFLRLHPSEEGSDAYNSLLDIDRVHYAGSRVAPSPVELLPYIDVMVTDYSSIYVDFLPFDRPIVFLKDRHEAFETERGIAFDYARYFPGATAESFDVFLEYLEAAFGDDDGYAADREFVREVLLPERDHSSLEYLEFILSDEKKELPAE